MSRSTYSLATGLPIGNIPVVGSAVPGVSTMIPAGSASSLFPEINPSATPSPSPGAQAGFGRQVQRKVRNDEGKKMIIPKRKGEKEKGDKTKNEENDKVLEKKVKNNKKNKK
jgi:hypothetical protein